MKKLADRSKEAIIHKKTLFGTVGRWPRSLNRGGRLMEVVSLLIYNKYFRDFDNWPFNRVWPLNRGSTVVLLLHRRFDCIKISIPHYEIKHMWIFANLLPQFSRLIQHLY